MNSVVFSLGCMGVRLVWFNRVYICLFGKFSGHRGGQALGRPLGLDLGVVAGELEADADVVLHAADLATECDAVLLEGVCAEFELVRVDLHLFLQAQEHALFVAGG